VTILGHLGFTVNRAKRGNTDLNPGISPLSFHVISVVEFNGKRESGSRPRPSAIPQLCRFTIPLERGAFTRSSKGEINFAPDKPIAAEQIYDMSTATAKLLSEFQMLHVEEKQEFVQEAIRCLPPWDSGPLDDSVVAAAGDELAAMLGEEESAS
jgi:hypothetical protein